MGNSTLYPAIDVRDGRVVRLHQGDYTQETRYETEPWRWPRVTPRPGPSGCT